MSGGAGSVRGPEKYAGGYVVQRRAGVCWITSEPDRADAAWRLGEPLAAVVVMIARAVDLDGVDITAEIAGAVRDALAAMTAEAGAGAADRTGSAGDQA